MLSLREAAVYLGVTEDYLWRLKAAGLIEYHQPTPHARIRFRREWLDAWVDSGRHSPEDRSSTAPRRRKSKPVAVPQCSELGH
jgi:excisionase family DNA binding protein